MGPEKGQDEPEQHGISFEEAASVFLDPLAVTYPDPDHSAIEVREITVGYSARQGLVLVSHTARGDRIRIIGARRLTLKERKKYEESIDKAN